MTRNRTRFGPLLALVPAPVLMLALVLAPVALLPATAAGQDGQKDTLAIFNFRPTTIEAMGFNGEILYALISALEKQKSVDVMPRRQMEQGLYQAGLVQADNPETAKKAGKVLGINFLLFGQVGKTGSSVTAHLKLMDIQQGRVVKTWSPIFSGRDDILAQVPGIVDQLILVIRQQRSGGDGGSGGPAEPDVNWVKAENKGNTVLIKWETDPALPVAGYHVYRSENESGPFQFHGISPTPGTFTDKSITKGRAYYYRLGLRMQSGREVKSRKTAFIKRAGEKIPHPPLVMKGEGHVRRADVVFVPSLLNSQERFDIRSYKVYRQEGEAWQEVGAVDANRRGKLEYVFEDTGGLADGGEFTYAISGMDSKGRESALSDPVSVRTTARPVLTVVRDDLLRAVELSWNPVEGATGYSLYRKAGEEDFKKVAVLKEDAAAGYLEKKGLDDGTVYTYRIAAFDDRGETGPSIEVTAKTKDLPPIPRNITARSGMVKSVKLSWTPVNDPDVGGYAVYRQENGEKPELVEKVKGYLSDGCLDDGSAFSSLEDGKTYRYAVVAYNLFGAERRPFPEFSATTKPRPVRVSGLALSPGADHVLVRWSRSPEADVTGYLIYRVRGSGDRYSKIGETPASRTAYSDYDVKAHQTYSYRVIAVDADELKSDPADAVITYEP